VSAAFGAWLRREREARGWSRSELACRMADAAGSAVTAPAHVLETYLSRWEAGHVVISARYRQLLDAVLGPGTGAPAAHPVSVPPGPRKWVRAKWAIESGIADGQWKPGDRLPARPALAQRYGLSVDAVMRAQDELLRAGVLRRGPVYGALYVSDAQDQQPPGAPPPAAPGELAPGDGLPEFMLVKECAAQLRVSPPIIYGLVKSGHVEAVRLGREFRIYTRSWLAYLQAPRPGLRPQREPQGDERDHPPQTGGPPAEPQPARGTGPGAPPVVFRAPR
jgi:excisionase family DNA binding protein